MPTLRSLMLAVASAVEPDPMPDHDRARQPAQ
jgi:hypothetical protein